eukprot:CAMPEP_0170503798 /NCGR_PEP_ID=MMETSP0208-20121228/45941_1 /TAXON_ID=197538 /ORGANISM="Strombidium inclinatum, Strain S3" /LENGTH=69 /DNA_ID=CAMNT_0010783649 /DNA_START=304 /DNA_END=513 /DNA_ORIENTATION=+
MGEKSHDITFGGPDQAPDARICTIKRYNLDYEPFPWLKFMREKCDDLGDDDAHDLILKLKEFYKMTDDS